MCLQAFHWCSSGSQPAIRDVEFPVDTVKLLNDVSKISNIRAPTWLANGNMLTMLHLAKVKRDAAASP